MSYDIVTVNAEIIDHFRHVLPDLEKKYEKKWVHFEVEKAWTHSVHVGQTVFHLHIKIGSFPNVHHYTVKFEFNHGKYHLIQVEEGLKTLF